MTERTRILELLAEGRINVDEAERLLEAVKAEERAPAAMPPGPETEPPAADGARGKPRLLRVLVTKTSGEVVNVRVPLALLRAGLKLKGLLPAQAHAQVDVAMKEKGLKFNLDELDGKALEEIVQALAETSVNVDKDGDTVRVFCE
ncbi:MAG: hypothetical protein WC326_10825 [Candidatus Delongbacteria bacterium]